LSVSKENVEKVVYEPTNPIVSALRSAADAVDRSVRSTNRNPRRKEPVTLTASVPHGKRVNRSLIAAPTP